MLLNQKQACGYLGIGRYIFETAVEKGLIPFIKPSKRKLFNTEDLDRWQKNTLKHTDFTKGVKRGMPIYRLQPLTVSTSKLESLYKQQFVKKPNNLSTLK
mgnify:CR=1 FL=1